MRSSGTVRRHADRLPRGQTLSSIEPHESECVHGMADPAWCSLCKNEKPSAGLLDAGPTFFAAFEGTCFGCGERFPTGARIRGHEGGYSHDRCIADE